MYHCGVLFALFMGGCQEHAQPVLFAALANRPVATIYRVNVSPDSTLVPCHRSPGNNAPYRTLLHDGQLVGLVSIEEGMLQRGDDYWLHVYPPLSHRPACYVNVRYLIPHA